MQKPDPDYLDEQTLGTRLANSAVDHVFQVSRSLASSLNAKVKNKTKRSYAEYLTKRQRTARQIRNLVYDTESAILDEIYVNSEIYRENTAVSDGDILHAMAGLENAGSWWKAKDEHDRLAPSLIVRGVGGSGKSMLARWLFLNCCKAQQLRIPLFVELRDIDSRALSDIANVLVAEITQYSSDVSHEQVSLGVEAGLFTIIFDGLDELHPDVETKFYEALRGFSKRFQHCPILVTTRPSESYLSWSDYSVFDIGALSPQNAKLLINKLKFDHNVKARFLREVDERLRITHAEYLKVPLLLVIMLITYADTGKISTKKHEFYEDVFNALWSKHDARKDGYERTRYTSLSKIDFLDITAAFAFLSYLDSKYIFRESEFEKYFDKARALTQKSISTEDFRLDLTVSTSLCVPEQDNLRFFHRSMQEYLSAYFISRSMDSSVRPFLDIISIKQETDTVLEMLLSMDSRRVERLFVSPALKDFLAKLGEAASAGERCEVYLRKGGTVWPIRRLFGIKPGRNELSEAIQSNYNGPYGDNRKLDEIIGDDANRLDGVLVRIEDKYSAMERELELHLELLLSKDTPR